MAIDAPAKVGCRDGCGRSYATEEEPTQQGWSWLPIVRGWRCPECRRALEAARSIEPLAAGEFLDPLPPTSRGALPKETASTIVAPTVPLTGEGE